MQNGPMIIGRLTCSPMPHLPDLPITLSCHSPHEPSQQALRSAVQHSYYTLALRPQSTRCILP
jgi:hypothetical protein